MRRLPLAYRLVFILQKYIGLIRILLFKKTASIKTGCVLFIANDLSALGTLQSSIVDFYSEIVTLNILTKKNPVIIDIGANIGQFCNASKLFYPSAKVYSFEPDSEVYQLLIRNTKSLPDLQTFNLGLGDKNEHLPFFVHPLSLMSSFQQDANSESTENNIKLLQLTKLDDISEIDAEVDLIKIDVEGFEYQVILGATSVLKRAKFLLIEIGIGRETQGATNMALLTKIQHVCPNARIVKIGRLLGDSANPICQDVLINLRG